MMKEKEKNGSPGAVVLTEGKPWQCILRFALPLFLGSLLQQLYYAADALMVGRLIGQQALSGVGTCGVLVNLLIALSVGFSTGAGVISARHFGAGKDRAVAENALATVTSLFVLGLLVGGAGFCWGARLLRWAVSVPDSLLGISGRYFRVCAAGFLFQFLYNGAAALLRSIGDSKASLYFLALSAGANVVLDYLLLAVCRMDVEGAALATVFSQVFACGASFAYLHRRYELLRFWGKGLRVSAKGIGEILKTGFPMALQSMSGTVFNLMIQRLVNSFGEAMTASYAVVSRVEGMMNLPTSSLYQALPTYTAQNIGAGKGERIRAGLGQAVAISLLVTLTLSTAAFACAPWLAEAFGIQGESAWYCAQHIRWISFPLLFFALYFPCLGLYQGAGKGMASTSLSVSYLAVCLLLAYGLRGIAGYRALFLCKPVSWALIAGVNYLYYFKGNWKKALAKELQSIGHSAQKFD